MNEMRKGQRVKCPEDRGSPAYVGIIESIGDKIQTNHKGDEYRWVTVRNP